MLGTALVLLVRSLPAALLESAVEVGVVWAVLDALMCAGHKMEDRGL